jgi:hypothetical protein
MACHIAAAAGGPGARRYVPSMTPDERCSIENGIWMCYTHGKLIDTDETRFTTAMLRKWRLIAEARARLAVELGSYEDVPASALSRLGLAESSTELSGIGKVNTVIGDALRDSCVPALWGEAVGRAIRDVVIELAHNAFTHGGARSFSMRVDGHAVRLSDNGASFDPWSLPSSKGAPGGAAAVGRLLEKFGDRLVVASRRSGDANETVMALVRSPGEIGRITPCFVELDYQKIRSEPLRVEVLQACNIIYVLVPEYTSISDAEILARKLSTALPADKVITFVVADVSDFVQERLMKHFPKSRVVTVKM